MHKPSHIREFSRNSTTYKSYNMIQKQVVKDLFKLIDFKPKTILDLGCGDGVVFSQIDWEFERFVGVDLSKEMLQLHPKGEDIELLQKDFDELDDDFLKQFDLVLSSSSLQWSKNPKKLIEKLQNTSKSFAVALFCDGTFKNLREFFSLETFLPKSKDIVSILHSDTYHDKKSYKLNFSDNLSLLRYIKKSGVSGGVKRTSISKLKEFLSCRDRSYLEFEILFIHSSKVFSKPILELS